MELQEISRNFAIEMTEEELMILDSIDYEDIAKRLREYDAEEIEYNPHFGPYFYFTSTKKNAYLVMAEVGDIIEEERNYGEI